MQFALKYSRPRPSAAKMSKSRDYVFTTNNYTDEHEAQLRELKCQYIVYGREVGEQGTPHLQGYVRFQHQKTMKAAHKGMPPSHLEIKKGTPAQAIAYCKKDGDVYERGEPPKTPKDGGQMEKDRWKEINKRAREGDEEWLQENEPRVYHTGLATFRSHKKPRTDVMTYADSDTPHEWWVGPTGTGKSKKLWEDHPGFYPKEQNKWWCNYNGQEVVAIEEASPKTMEHLASRLKVWADRYPFPGEIKGGRIEGMRPAKLLVLSNYTIEECFPNPEDSEPLKRRFKVIRFGDRPAAWHHSYNKQ